MAAALDGLTPHTQAVICDLSEAGDALVAAREALMAAELRWATALAVADTTRYLPGDYVVGVVWSVAQRSTQAWLP